MNTTDETLTTAELAARWSVSRQRVHQRAATYPEILRPIRRSRAMTLWPLADIERFEREILGPGGARRTSG